MPAPALVLSANTMELVARERGRPSLYSRELAETICLLMANGNSLAQIVKMPGMPARATINRWILEKPEFRELYTRARDDLVQFWADETIEIADDKSGDTILQSSERGEFITPNSANVARDKLRVDARRWLISKLAPGQYGDKPTVEVQNNQTIVLGEIDSQL